MYTHVFRWDEPILNFRPQVEVLPEDVQLPIHKGNIVRVLVAYRQARSGQPVVSVAGELAYLTITPLRVMTLALIRSAVRPAR